jgi:hypothetical protein
VRQGRGGLAKSTITLLGPIHSREPRVHNPACPTFITLEIQRNNAMSLRYYLFGLFCWQSTCALSFPSRVAQRPLLPERQDDTRPSTAKVMLEFTESRSYQVHMIEVPLRRRMCSGTSVCVSPTQF